MRTRHIEVFQAVHRTGSITRAAELLCISQPAASKLLAHAEATLGFRLFERVKGRLQLTREAEMLAPAVNKVFRDLEEVRRLSRNLRNQPAGHLRLGCTPTLGLSVLPQTMALSQQAHPDISLELKTAHSEQLADALLAREITLAVVFNPRHYPGLRSLELGEAELVCLDGSQETSPVAVQDLEAERLISLPADDPLGELLQPYLPGAGGRLQVQTYSVACALAQAGAGIALIDSLTAGALLRPGQRTRSLLPPLRFKVTALVHEATVLSKLEKDFLERLRQVLD